MVGIVTASVIGGAAAVYGAKKSASAAEDAARLQSQSADEGMQFQREALGQLRQDLAPYSTFGQAALNPLAQAMGINQDFAQAQVQRTIDQGAPVIGQAPTFSQQSMAEQLQSDPQKMARYQRQLEKVNSMSEGEPSYDDEYRLLTALESQLPMQDLASITPVTDLAKKRLGNYYAEKNITPPSGVPQRVRRPGGGFMAAAPQRTQGMTATAPGGVDMGIGAPINPLLAQAVQERAAFDPLQNPLFAQAAQERADFDPMANPLLAQAVEEQQAYDPSNVLGPELLQNPLLQALQKDVTRRLTANQAARGKLGSGGTAEALQERLVPQAINFGLQLDQLQRQAIADRARLGTGVLGLQEAAISGREQTGLRQIGLQEGAIAGRESTGAALEDLRQRQIQNLQTAAQIGQNAAARTGTSGLNTASNIGQLGIFGAQSEAAGRLAAQQAQNAGIGAAAGAIGDVIGTVGGRVSGTQTPQIQTYGMNPQATAGYPTNAQWDQLGLDQQIIPKY